MNLSTIMDRNTCVPTLREIEEWRKKHNITRRALAELLHVNYKALCPVLAGTKPLTPQLAARIGDLMENYDKGLVVTLPHEFAPLLRMWAETAQITVDELVTRLLADCLKIQRSNDKEA